MLNLLSPIEVSVVGTLSAIVCAFFSISNVTAKSLSGNVLDARSNEPIDSVIVALENHTATSMTNESGRFQINTNGCRSCRVGDKVKLMIHDLRPNGWGFHIEEHVISSDFSVIVKIRRNNFVAVQGEVFDAESKKPLEGIRVTCMPESLVAGKSFPETVSNHLGLFVLPVQASMITEKRYLRMIYSDPDGKYKHLSELADIRSMQRVMLVRSEEVRFKLRVKGELTFDRLLDPGDRIVILADGVMSVGRVLGVSGPVGIESEIVGPLVARYSVTTRFNHAALLFRFSTEGGDAWRPVGDEREIEVLKSGYLQFMINDTNLSDNSGAYDVEIEVR